MSDQSTLIVLGALAGLVVMSISGFYWMYRHETSKYYLLAERLQPLPCRVQFTLRNWTTVLSGNYRGYPFRFTYDDRHSISQRSVLILDAPMAVGASVNSGNLARFVNTQNGTVKSLNSLGLILSLDLKSANGVTSSATSLPYEELPDSKNLVLSPLLNQERPGIALCLMSPYVFDPRFFNNELATLYSLATDTAAQNMLKNAPALKTL